jgi:hypothetical protein
MFPDENPLVRNEERIFGEKTALSMNNKNRKASIESVALEFVLE